MADAALIAELLRQKQYERYNPQPNPFVQDMNQVMQGLLQGLQLYSAVKDVGYKYGTNKKVPVPGQQPAAQPSLPAVPPGIPPSFSPGQVPQPGGTSLNPSTASSYVGRMMPSTTPVIPPSATGDAPADAPQPGILSRLAQMFQRQPTQTAHTPGTYDAEIMKNLAALSPAMAGQYGASKNIGSAPELTGQIEENMLRPVTVVGKDGTPTTTYVRGKGSVVNAGATQGAEAYRQQRLELDRQRLELSRQEAATRISEFQQRQRDANNKALEDRKEKLVIPLLNGLKDKKLSQNADFVSFANDAIQAIQDSPTAEMPDVIRQKAKFFGVETPEWLKSGKTVVKPGAAPSAQGQIKVRRKADGVTGSIDAADFDPAKYERI